MEKIIIRFLLILSVLSLGCQKDDELPATNPFLDRELIAQRGGRDFYNWDEWSYQTDSIYYRDAANQIEHWYYFHCQWYPDSMKSFDCVEIKKSKLYLDSKSFTYTIQMDVELVIYTKSCNELDKTYIDLLSPDEVTYRFRIEDHGTFENSKEEISGTCRHPAGHACTMDYWVITLNSDNAENEFTVIIESVFVIDPLNSLRVMFRNGDNLLNSYFL